MKDPEAAPQTTLQVSYYRCTDEAAVPEESDRPEPVDLNPYLGPMAKSIAQHTQKLGMQTEG